MKCFVAFTLVLLALVNAEMPSSMQDLTQKETPACQNFYTHACGTWLKKTKLKDGQVGEVRTSNAVLKANKKIVDGILKNDDKVSAFIASCNDMESINALGTSPLQEGLDLIADTDDIFDCFKVLGQLSQTYPQFFVTSEVELDPEDSSKTILRMQPGEKILMTEEAYEVKAWFKSFRGAVQQYVMNMTEVVDLKSFVDRVYDGDLDEDDDRAAKMAERIVDVEQKLATIFKHYKVADPDKQDRTSIIQLYRNKLLEYYVKGVNEDNSHKDLGRKQTIIIHGKSYFDGLYMAIRDVKDLKLYMGFLLIHTLAAYLSQSVVDVQFNFLGKALLGDTQRIPREDMCKAKAMEIFNEWIGEKFAEEALSDTIKSRAKEITDNIIEEAKARIENTKWLHDDAKDMATEKMNNLYVILGSNDYAWTSDLDLEPDAYFENMKKIWNAKFAEDMARLDDDVDVETWPMKALHQSPVYEPNVHRIVVPAAFLQPPIFDTDMPEAHQYATMGFMFAREVTHVVDRLGRAFDKDGTPLEDGWWTWTTASDYRQREECITKIYTGKGNGKKLNGKRAADENLADVSAIELAFGAYKKANGGISDEDVKTFYTAFAQNLCIKETSAQFNAEMANAVMVPNLFRVNGLMKNTKGFADAFKCKDKDPMNHFGTKEKRCNFW